MFGWFLGWSIPAGFLASGPLVSFGFCVCFSAVLSSTFVFVVRLMLGFWGLAYYGVWLLWGLLFGVGVLGCVGWLMLGLLLLGPLSTWLLIGLVGGLLCLRLLFTDCFVLLCWVLFCYCAVLQDCCCICLLAACLCGSAAATLLLLGFCSAASFACATCRLLLFGWQFCKAGSAAFWAFCFAWSWLFVLDPLILSNCIFFYCFKLGLFFWAVTYVGLIGLYLL